VVHDVGQRERRQAAAALTSQVICTRSAPGAARAPQAGQAGQAAREQAERAEQPKQELAREARKAEREQARHDHDKARERYEGLTKAELSDQLDQRDLPKSGSVDELVERLVEADGK
jgi:hypothetical protein